MALASGGTSLVDRRGSNNPAHRNHTSFGRFPEETLRLLAYLGHTAAQNEIERRGLEPNAAYFKPFSRGPWVPTEVRNWPSALVLWGKEPCLVAIRATLAWGTQHGIKAWQRASSIIDNIHEAEGETEARSYVAQNDRYVGYSAAGVPGGIISPGQIEPFTSWAGVYAVKATLGAEVHRSHLEPRLFRFRSLVPAYAPRPLVYIAWRLGSALDLTSMESETQSHVRFFGSGVSQHLRESVLLHYDSNPMQPQRPPRASKNEQSPEEGPGDGRSLGAEPGGDSLLGE